MEFETEEREKQKTAAVDLESRLRVIGNLDAGSEHTMGDRVSDAAKRSTQTAADLTVEVTERRHALKQRCTEISARLAAADANCTHRFDEFERALGQLDHAAGGRARHQWGEEQAAQQRRAFRESLAAQHAWVWHRELCGHDEHGTRNYENGDVLHALRWTTCTTSHHEVTASCSAQAWRECTVLQVRDGALRVHFVEDGACSIYDGWLPTGGASTTIQTVEEGIGKALRESEAALAALRRQHDAELPAAEREMYAEAETSIIQKLEQVAKAFSLVGAQALLSCYGARDPHWEQVASTLGLARVDLCVLQRECQKSAENRALRSSADDLARVSIVPPPTHLHERVEVLACTVAKITDGAAPTPTGQRPDAEREHTNDARIAEDSAAPHETVNQLRGALALQLTRAQAGNGNGFHESLGSVGAMDSVEQLLARQAAGRHDTEQKSADSVTEGQTPPEKRLRDLERLQLLKEQCANTTEELKDLLSEYTEAWAAASSTWDTSSDAQARVRLRQLMVRHGEEQQKRDKNHAQDTPRQNKMAEVWIEELKSSRQAMEEDIESKQKERGQSEDEIKKGQEEREQVHEEHTKKMEAFEQMVAMEVAAEAQRKTVERANDLDSLALPQLPQPTAGSKHSTRWELTADGTDSVQTRAAEADRRKQALTLQARWSAVPDATVAAEGGTTTVLDDGSVELGQLQEEMEAMQLGRALVYLDSRTITHRPLLHAFREAQLANNSEGSEAVTAGASWLPPEKHVKDAVDGSFSVTAVVRAAGAECDTWPFVLLSDFFFDFDGLHERLRKDKKHPAFIDGASDNDDDPDTDAVQVHTLVVACERHSEDSGSEDSEGEEEECSETCTRTLTYFIDGKQKLVDVVVELAAKRAPSIDLYARLRELWIDGEMGLVPQSSAVHLRVLVLLMHSRALSEDEATRLKKSLGNWDVVDDPPPQQPLRGWLSELLAWLRRAEQRGQLHIDLEGDKFEPAQLSAGDDQSKFVPCGLLSRASFGISTGQASTGSSQHILDISRTVETLEPLLHEVRQQDKTSYDLDLKGAVGTIEDLRAPLHSMLVADSEMIKREPLNAAQRPTPLGYKLKPKKQTPFAKLFFDRIEKSLVDFEASNGGDRYRSRLACIGTEFDSLSMGLRVSTLRAALSGVEHIHTSLRKKAQEELTHVNNALYILTKLSTYCGKQMTGSTSIKPHQRLHERNTYQLLQMGNHEIAPDFHFIVTSILAPREEAIEQWGLYNPFLGLEVRRDLLRLATVSPAAFQLGVGKVWHLQSMQRLCGLSLMDHSFINTTAIYKHDILRTCCYFERTCASWIGDGTESEFDLVDQHYRAGLRHA